MNIVDQASSLLPPAPYMHNAVYPHCRNIPGINYYLKQRRDTLSLMEVSSAKEINSLLHFPIE